MEYIEGETLSELIAPRAPLPLSRRIEFAHDLCTGLGYAHRTGIVHGDIQPATS